MDVEMVFNELSAESPASDIPTAKKWMSDFIKTTVWATSKYKVKRVLRIEKDFFSIQIAPNYLINQCINQDKEVKRWFNTLITKYPALAGFEDSEIEGQYIETEFCYKKKFSHGLGIAYLLDALAVSINSAEWNESQINLKAFQKNLTVHHASLPEHVTKNAEWIKLQQQKGDPWLKHNLPKTGEYSYLPHRDYYLHKKSDFPTKNYRDKKGFLDVKKQLWIWHEEENHWDVQSCPYKKDNYFRVTSDGRLLDK